MTIIVRADESGRAPWHSRYYAIDDDTYDGAEDSSNRHQVGRGASPDEAYAALSCLMMASSPTTSTSTCSPCTGSNPSSSHIRGI